jgi:hypothetical protein
MNQTVTLLLLLEGGNLSSTEKRALATFQTREKVVLIAPRPVSGGAPPALYARPSVPTPSLDEVAARIESALEEAQTLAASLDEERALVVLAGVERDLLLHPLLPQAAWLMAERHQLAAAIRRKQPDGAAEAEALVAAARALEGPRAAPFGEGGPAPVEPAAPAAPARLDVLDLDGADRLVLDGRLASRSESVLPGRHHARVLRDSSVAWAGWLEVPAEVRVGKLLGVPPRVACSEDDLRDVRLGTEAPVVPVGVRCGRWIGVRRGNGRLEVSWCEGARCTAYGPLLAEPKATEPSSSLPPWAAATIVGAATLGAGSVLIFTGAFERERPPPVKRIVYQGP